MSLWRWYKWRDSITSRQRQNTNRQLKHFCHSHHWLICTTLVMPLALTFVYLVSQCHFVMLKCMQQQERQVTSSPYYKSFLHNIWTYYNQTGIQAMLSRPMQFMVKESQFCATSPIMNVLLQIKFLIKNPHYKHKHCIVWFLTTFTQGGLLYWSTQQALFLLTWTSGVVHFCCVHISWFLLT